MSTNSNNLQRKETIYLSHLDGSIREENFNKNWKFSLGDLTNAKETNYDDSSWENLNLPHDYSLNQEYTPEGEAESGYKLGGIAWYRKYFTVDNLEDKKLFLDFDGVYMHATVYINGVELGSHFNGYTPFSFDLTDHLHDGENILAVRVNNPVPSSRWYSGSGIYRDVNVRIVDNIYVAQYGVNIKTPKLEEQVDEEVDVNIKTTINNSSSNNEKISIHQSIYKKSNNTIIASAETEISIAANSTQEVEQNLIVDNPELWSIKNPHLYEVKTTLIVDGTTLDQKKDHFGFRFISFDNDTGFALNRERMKIQGVCMHHDNGALGAVAHHAAIKRKIEILKDMGVNAIRVAHNPASSAFIKLADEMGILVFDESFDGWLDPKNGNRNDYSNFFSEEIDEDNDIINIHNARTWAEFDLKQMVSRAINSPAVIAWSLGNEVMEGIAANPKNYPEVLEKLIPWALEVDDSRPVTIGDNKFKENWPEALSFGEQLAQVNGVIGMNYTQAHQFDQFRENYPDWKIIASETASAINSRGIYNPELYERLLTSYDTSTVGWGNVASDSWNMVVRRDYIAGEFVWTGFDYLGEPTPWNGVGTGSIGKWPAPKSSYFGIVDLAGLPKDTYYFYKSQWDKENTTLHILPAWDDALLGKDDNGNVIVNVYSNAAAVELFLKTDDETQSFGRKEFTKNTTEAGFTYQTYIEDGRDEDDHRNLYLEWTVPYQDGELYAVAYDENGNVIEETVGTSRSKTPTEASKLSATTETKTLIANDYDLAYITIDILDENNELVRFADNRIEVSVEGEGKLLALDNGHQVDHEPYDSGSRKALSGKLVAVVQSTNRTGEILVNINSEGLEPAQVKLNIVASDNAENQNEVLAYSMVRNYFVQVEENVALADVVELELSNGDIVEERLLWPEDIDTSKTGQFTLRAIVENFDFPVHAKLTVLAPGTRVLNYSTLIPMGSKSANLPVTRPLVSKDGTILSSEIDVDWDEVGPESFANEGIVQVNGYSELFDKKITVTASVRVTEYHRELKGNVAGNYQILTENTPEEFRSNNLRAIVQGDVDTENSWTNTKAHETGINSSEIIFTYATAQQIGAARLYFLKNEDFKPADEAELFWSLDASDLNNTVWEKIELTSTQDEESSTLFEFNGVPAVGFKIKLSSEQAFGLSKIELLLEELSLVGSSNVEVEDFEQAIETSRTSSNAAVTAISNNDETIIIVESEDKTRVEKYKI